MKILTWTFFALLLLIQYPLWFGKGGWWEVWELQSKIDDQLVTNKNLDDRNSAVRAQISDLKTGLDEVEERARSELGMIRSGEVFFKTIKKRDLKEQNSSTKN